ncbi:MAG: flagellar FliJ family protein [Planctomycetota bacterium]
MAAFRFKLEPVLRQREMAEDRQRREVAAIERERHELEEVIRACQRSIVREKEDLAGVLGAAGERSVDLRTARVQANASLHQVSRAQQAVLLLAGVHKRLESARAELARLAAARRAVELLRERRLREWKRSEARKEARAIDELVVARYRPMEPGEEPR